MDQLILYRNVKTIVGTSLLNKGKDKYEGKNDYLTILSFMKEKNNSKGKKKKSIKNIF